MNAIYTNSPRCQSCVRYTVKYYSEWCDMGIGLQACDDTCKGNPDKCNSYIKKRRLNYDTQRNNKRS